MPAQRKYPDELRERAVRMVLEIRARDGKGRGELARVGRQLGVHPEALRGWVKQAASYPAISAKIPNTSLPCAVVVSMIPVW
jgi:transposase-like protein